MTVKQNLMNHLIFIMTVKPSLMIRSNFMSTHNRLIQMRTLMMRVEGRCGDDMNGECGKGFLKNAAMHKTLEMSSSAVSKSRLSRPIFGAIY